MIPSIHIIGAKKFGGAENFFVRLINTLNKNKHPVIAVSPPHCELSPLIDNSIEQKHFKMRNVYDLISRWQINSLIRKSGYQIIQTYMGRATRLTNISKLKPIIHIARLGGFYNLKGYRHAHAWIGNTQGICDYLVQNGFDSRQVFHISNFVDSPENVSQTELNQLRQQLNIPSEAKVILSVGRLHQNKAYDTLLKAFHHFKQSCSIPTYLLIVGDGPEKNKLIDLAQSLRLSEFIRWAGWQTKTAPYYSIADIFVCSSRHEPLGNVILEAWSYKLPVISTKTQGPIEFIENNHDAIIVDIDNDLALADSLSSTLENHDARTNLGNAGYQKIQSQFSQEKILAQYLAAYETLIKHRHSKL